MRTVSIVTEIPTSAEVYHALRQDREFDKFCAVDDHAQYSLISETETVEEGHVVLTVESMLDYGQKKLPSSVRRVLGAPDSARTTRCCARGRVAGKGRIAVLKLSLIHI